MSRKIDPERIRSGDLSEAELRYLEVRGRLPKGAPSQIEGETPEEMALEDRANTGTANTFGLTKEEYEEVLARRAAKAGPNPNLPPSAEPESDTSGDDDEDEEDMDYSTMTNDALRAEIARRNADRDDDDKLSLDGPKAELIATLEADDEDDEDGD